MGYPRIHLEALLALAAIVFVEGCISLSKGPPEKRYYALEAARPTEAAALTAGAILKIRKFRISPPFEGVELVYRTGEARYETDFYNEWFASPSAMLTQQLVSWLTNAGLFRHVVDSSSSLEADYILEGTVKALCADLRENGSPKAVLNLQIVLIKDRPTQERIVFRRQYQDVVDVGNSSPDALVNGWNRGLQHSLLTLEEDLRSADLEWPSKTGRPAEPAAGDK